MAPFMLIRSESLLRGRAFNVRRDHVQTPDGRETQYDIVEHVGSVVMVPIDADGNLLFVRQYRHAAGQDVLELPAGTRDGDEPYMICAAREMREETGMAAGSLVQIGTFYLAPGYSTEVMAVFIATELNADALEADPDEFLEVEKIPIKKALLMAENGDVQDAKSLAALLLAKHSFAQYL